MSEHALSKAVNNIKDEKLRKYVEEVLAKVPDYFWTIAASSTGKYHPEYSLGEGGLIRHTRAAVQIALELFGNNSVQAFSDIEKDVIVGALILHDSVKHGMPRSKYTKADHAMWVEKIAEFDVDQGDSKDPKVVMFKAIRSHMGEWNTEWGGTEEVAPKPVSRIERFVHMCDYLASRKCLEMNFDHALV